ncbi:MAG: SDR family NAD(P)-dependent oxidoreductase [Cytophagales bacterium]
MSKNILIVGMGPGLSLGIAEKFGKEGFQIGMISRSEAKLAGFKMHLQSLGVNSAFAVADVSDTNQLLNAIRNIKTQIGKIDILQYNAVDARMKFLMDETVEDLANGFKISVGNAYAAAKELLPDLKEAKGSILFTGGGSANFPNPAMASISLGKAGIKNLTYQLSQVLKPIGVFVGTVTIGGWITPESETHSPKILAEKFWELNEKRSQIEIVY